MGRDTLQWADENRFADVIHRTFGKADAGLLMRARAFALKRTGPGEAPDYRAAALLLEQEADAVTIAAALLAPIVWQGLATPDDLREHVAPSVAAVLQGLGSPYLPCTHSRSDRSEGIRVLLASMGGVPRKALLFIAFRLLALECAPDTCGAAARKMARETLDLFVPIADRLSLGDLRRRLEDACFHILDPEGYAVLREKVAPIQAEDDRCLQILLVGVRRLLDNNGIQGRVQGRTKSLHAIRRKMLRTGRTLEEIMDRIGLRVIVTSVPACYTVLGLLHAHFKPIPGTFDDYIGLPKDNGYQSLHTCVYPIREISHKPIEIQVRTELMHLEAEYGMAAHWRYKREGTLRDRGHQQAQWMVGLMQQHKEAGSNEAFVERLYRQVFRNHLVVFGSGGRIVRLADKSTVYDYLRITNTRLTKGGQVRVNGRTVGMNHSLRDGDSVEVLDGGRSCRPDRGEPSGHKGPCALLDGKPSRAAGASAEAPFMPVDKSCR